MKRMVLIPEDRLLSLEQQDKQRIENTHDNNKLSKTVMHGGGEETKKDSLTPEMIVRGILKSMKTRALALLAHLKEKENDITWDDAGQVTLKGVFVPKSNISELISDAMRPRKHFNPVGVHEFYVMLNDINIPKDLVRNEGRWSETSKNEVSSKGKPLKGSEWISNWITF